MRTELSFGFNYMQEIANHRNSRNNGVVVVRVFKEWEGALSGGIMGNYFKEFCYKGQKRNWAVASGRMWMRESPFSFVSNEINNSTYFCFGGSCRRMRDYVLGVVLCRPGSYTGQHPVSSSTEGQKAEGAWSLHLLSDQVPWLLVWRQGWGSLEVLF